MLRKGNRTGNSDKGSHEYGRKKIIMLDYVGNVAKKAQFNRFPLPP